MVKIGLVVDENESKIVSELEYLLGLDCYILSLVKKKEQIEYLDGLVISMVDKNEIIKVIDWLLACKLNSQVFVWVFSGHRLDHEKTIMMNLGANGVVEGNINLTYLSLAIKNTFSRLTKKKCRKFSEELLDENNRSVYVDGEFIQLTRKEFTLIRILYEEKNKTVCYDELLKTLWKNNSQKNLPILANLIFHLRKKLEKSTDFEIKTIRSKGYLLKCE